MPDLEPDADARAHELDWARRLYRGMAPVFGAFRWGLGAWTRSAEMELDRLFAERVGPTTRILELAPGTGINIARLLRCAPGFASYLGIDISPEMLARARRKAGADSRFELRIGDAAALADVEGPFDFVICTWLLAHLDEPATAVANANAKLAPGGSAVFVFLGAPDHGLVQAAIRPVLRWLRTPPLDPEPIGRIPHLERMTRHGGGLATLALFRKPR